LHLTEAPIRLVWVADKLAWFEFSHLQGVLYACSIPQRKAGAMDLEMQVPASATPPARLLGPDPLLLAGTLSNRLCHDLSGSLGALAGTLEMAAEEGDQEALALAMVLAQEMSARLRLLRAAWGAGSELPELETLLPGLPGADRLKLDASNLTTTDERMRRLALMFLLVAAAGLPRGGTIRLGGTDQGFWVEIEGVRAAWPAELETCLAESHALLEACERPRALAVALSCLHARARGLTIGINSPTRLTVS